MSVWCSTSIFHMSAFARIIICECEKQLESGETLMRRHDEPDSAESRAKLGFWCKPIFSAARIVIDYDR